MWIQTITDTKNCHSCQRAIHYLHKESCYQNIYGKHTLDCCVPPLNVRKNITKSFERFRKISNRYVLWPLHFSQQAFQQDWRPSRVWVHDNFLYSHPQAISKAYNIIKKTGKLRESIKSWNGLPPIQNMWIAFKAHFWSTSITHQDWRIELWRSWIRASKSCQKHHEPPLWVIPSPRKHGEHCPTWRSCTINCNRNHRDSTTSSCSESRTDVTSFCQIWGKWQLKHQHASYSLHQTLSRKTSSSNARIFR